jgi:Zn-dependent protease with chaperone function
MLDSAMKDQALSRRLLEWLMVLYYPVVGAVCAASVLVAVLAIIGASQAPRGLNYLLIFLAVVAALTALDVVLACRVFLGTVPEYRDELEIHPPPQWVDGLTRLTAEVARRRNLPVPDEIRLHAADIAHVYETREGRKVLVVGGPAIAMLTIRSLAGVIAHELGHFAAGDTALLREGRTRRMSMGVLVASFEERPASVLNPLTWIIRGYHFLYAVAFSLNSRDQEYAADRHEAQLVGPDTAATTSVLISALEALPWANLFSIAESSSEMRIPLEQIYSEQAKRSKQLSASQWEDACRKALKAKTDLFDSHPCLRERLHAIGVSSQRAMEIARTLEQTGKPATALFVNWSVVEKLLTERVVARVREVTQFRRAVAALVLGKPE